MAVEAFKMSKVPSMYAPLLAIAFGLAFGSLMGEPIQGIVFGLSASGLYSGGKTVLKNLK